MALTIKRSTQRKPQFKGAIASPGNRRVQAFFDAWKTRLGLEGVAIGQRVRDGKRRPEIVLSCFVREKRDVAPQRMVRSSVKWAPRRTIGTDVLEIEDFKFQGAPPVVSPADTVSAFLPSGKSRGSVGVIIRHPVLGVCVTTAAHVVGLRQEGEISFPNPQDRPPIRFSNAPQGTTPATFRGQVLKATLGASSDYALIQPEFPQRCANRFSDVRPLSAPFIPTAIDIGKRFMVLTSTGARAARLRFIHHTVNIGGVVLQDLLLTDLSTDEGDSGTTLVDVHGRILGLLTGFGRVGGVPVSAFTPVFSLLTREGAELLTT